MKKPYVTLYLNKDEFELVTLLVTVAAAGIIVDKKWAPVAVPLNVRLSELIIKFNNKNVRIQKKGSSTGADNIG